MKTQFMILMTLLFTSMGFNLQERMITGRVTSADDGQPIPGVTVSLKGSQNTVLTDADGKYSIAVPVKGGTLVFAMIGLKTFEVRVGEQNSIDVKLSPDVMQLNEVVVTGTGRDRQHKHEMNSSIPSHYYPAQAPYPGDFRYPNYNTEEYDGINENIFHDAARNPLSTFSIDVDAASYSNVRRFIQHGQSPPPDAVRIEEMINYFDYDYPQPKGEHPFSITTEISVAPWNPKHKLIHIGLQGKQIPAEQLPPANLVFLIDVSGSMNAPNRLPLVKSSFKLLVNQLRPQDHVAIVVYAGAAGLVLEPTPGDHQEKILRAIDKLEAGGSTAGGAGLRLAYRVAREHYRKNGNNRVILATDGDFNVGESSNAAMERLIEEERQSGVYLTVLGYGMGNYKDSKMETLSNKGNGNYAYIDNMNEARKVLVNEFAGTLFSIAKDVKLQIEFNPALVQAYRLIGYENRILRHEDFNNDKKDAGDLGSGHTVTALYEIIPAGVSSKYFKTDPLKYQTTTVNPQASRSNELMTVKFRYKQPDEETSRLMEQTLKDNASTLDRTSENFRWSAAVAAFGMALRNTEYLNGYSHESILTLARAAKGKDRQGYRSEFINLVESHQLLVSSR